MTRRNTSLAVLAAAVVVGAVVLPVAWWLAIGRALRADASPAASLQIESTEWDFGVVSLDQATLTHAFPVLNAGSDPIELRPLGSSCNCLSVKCPDTLGPGESGEIRVELEVRRREGRFGTTALVETTDPAAPVVRLALRFYGEPAVVVDPPFVKFDDALRGEVLRKEFRVLSTIRDEGQMHQAQPELRCESKAVAWIHLGRQILPGPRGDPELKHLEDRYALSFDTRVAGHESTFATTITIACPAAPESSSREVSLNVQATFRHHPWVLGPTAVTLRRGGTSKMRLTARDGSALCITRVTSPLQGLQYVWEPKTAASYQLLALTLESAAGGGTEIEGTSVEVYLDRWPDSPSRDRSTTSVRIFPRPIVTGSCGISRWPAGPVSP